MIAAKAKEKAMQTQTQISKTSKPVAVVVRIAVEPNAFAQLKARRAAAGLK